VKPLRLLLASGALLLVGCAGTTTIEVVQRPTGAVAPAAPSALSDDTDADEPSEQDPDPAPSSDSAAHAESTAVAGETESPADAGQVDSAASETQADSAASTSQADSAASETQADSAASETQADSAASTVQVANPDISETDWCAGLGLRIHHATKATIAAESLEIGNLADSVEELHRLFREAASARPAGVAGLIDTVNEALDVLEPVLQPVDWDFSAIDRTPIEQANRAYGASGMAIDEFNSSTCGFERATLLPAEDQPFDIDAPSSGPEPTPGPPEDPLIPTELEIDLFMGQVVGATRQEAACFLEYRYGVQEGAEPAGALDRLIACGMSIDRVADLDLIGLIATGSSSAPRNDNMIAAMVRQAEWSGMTNPEATCFVDSYVGMVENGLASDVALQQLLGCGLTVERMAEIGLPAGCPWRPGVCAADN